MERLHCRLLVQSIAEPSLGRQQSGHAVITILGRQAPDLGLLLQGLEKV